MNAEAARDALNAAQKKHDDGDDDGARRFLDKALRLDSSLEKDASALNEWFAK